MALILLWVMGGTNGNPGTNCHHETRADMGRRRSVVFWMHYHIGSRASKLPLSAMTSADQSQRVHTSLLSLCKILWPQDGMAARLVCSNI